tara:strand:- start:779 stop:1096 length:318 start_codon:yes stop_codon:yes gene_type:complete
MTNIEDNTILIERVEPPPEVKRKMNREFLPKNIQETMIAMEDLESFFLPAQDQDKKMFTLRSMLYRHYEKEGKDFKYSLSKETKDGQLGIRVYKYQSDGETADEY